MEKNEKQVIMTYDEHQQWITERALYRQDLDKIGDKLADQEKIMEKLIEERDDIVVIERHKMMVQENWRVRPGHSLGYHSYEDRYINFPRFLSGDELAKELDRGFMEMHGEIRNLQAERNDMEAGRKKDKMDFEKMNKTIPINVWNAMSDRQRERIRKMLHRTHQKLAKK